MDVEEDDRYDFHPTNNNSSLQDALEAAIEEDRFNRLKFRIY
jgi:hypothetical protein